MAQASRVVTVIPIQVVTTLVVVVEVRLLWVVRLLLPAALAVRALSQALQVPLLLLVEVVAVALA
jgi:hypothetical protein